MNALHRTLCIAALAVSTAGSIAWADDCPELLKDMAASRKTIDASVGDDKADIPDLMAKNDAISQKMHSRCQGKYDDHEQQAWARQQERKRDAAKMCAELRAYKPKASYYNDSERENEQDDNTEKAAQCLKDLLPFGPSLNPNLNACLATCQESFEKFVKRSPECLDRIEKAVAVLKEMRAFIEEKKTGKTLDVLTDFNVLAQKYDRVGLKKCILPDTVPEITTVYDQLRAEANAIGSYDEAKRDWEKASPTGKDWYRPHGSAESCMMNVVVIPLRDAKLDKMYTECKVIRDKAATPPSSNASAAPAKSSPPVSKHKSGRR